MFRARVVAALLAGLALAGTAGARPAALTPDRTSTRPGPIETLALTGRAVAYVVGETRTQCAHVELWQPASGRTSRFGKPTPIPCKEGPSTGSGVWELGLARTRVLWTTYVGGNFREWQLWTATPTRTTPRRLRFVARDVDDPAPIVVGPGTAAGVPYAVDREVVYLGENGRAIFRTTVAAPVRALAAGSGRDGVRVAALLSSREVVGLNARGEEILAFDAQGPVTAVRVTALGIAMQVGREVTIERSVTIPAGARMVDFAQGRVLWLRGPDLGTTTVTGRTARLVDGTPSKPVSGQLEAAGIAWARGRTLFWRAGPLPP